MIGYEAFMVAGGEDMTINIESLRHQARVDLAAAHQIAVLHQFNEAIDNHFTMMVPGRPGYFYLNSYGLLWTEVSASNLIEVSYDGEVTDEAGVAEISAVTIHAPVHRLVKGAVCILHAHMPFSTALTQLDDMTVEMTGQNALLFMDSIAYDYDYTGFADTMEEGERLAATMGGKPILMLANHGVIVSGRSVAEAYHRLYFLERACQTQIYSMSTGQKRRFVTPAVMEKVRRQMATTSARLPKSESDLFFDAMKRQLKAAGSVFEN